MGSLYCSLCFHVHLRFSSLKSPLKFFSKSAKLNLNLPTSTSTLHHHPSKPLINKTPSGPSALPRPHLPHPPPAGPLQRDTSAHFQAASHLFSTRQPGAPQKHMRHACISHTCSPGYRIKSAVLREASAPGPMQPHPRCSPIPGPQQDRVPAATFHIRSGICPLPPALKHPPSRMDLW